MANVAEVTLPGKIQAQHVISIAVPIEGTIETFDVETGQEVAEGQVLARIKSGKLDSDYDAASLDLEKTKTRVANLESAIIAARLEGSRARADESRSRTESEHASKALARQQMLLGEGATPRLVFESAQREHEKLKAEHENLEAVAKQVEARLDSMTKQLDTAHRELEERAQEVEDSKSDLGAGEVRSPADGMVIARRGQAGDAVDRAMKDLFQIAVDLNALEVVVDPEPPVLARIHRGQSAVIQIAENPNEGIPGTVKGVKNNQVIVEFVNPISAIRPGLTAQVRIKLM